MVPSQNLRILADVVGFRFDGDDARLCGAERSGFWVRGTHGDEARSGGTATTCERAPPCGTHGSGVPLSGTAAFAVPYLVMLPRKRTSSPVD